MKIVNVSNNPTSLSESDWEMIRMIYINRKESALSDYETYENQFLDDISSGNISIED